MRIGTRKVKGKRGIVLSQLRFKLRMAYQNRDGREVEYILKWLMDFVYIVDAKNYVASSIIACLQDAIDSADWQKIEELLQCLSDTDKNSSAYYRLIKGGSKRFTLHSIQNNYICAA